jgi:hypothetical protein
VSIPPPSDGVEPTVVVARTVGGLVLLLIGFALLVAGAFGSIVVPFIAPFAGGIWNTLWDLDFVAAIVGGIGFVILIFAGTLIRRAKKRSVTSSEVPEQIAANLQTMMDQATPPETRTAPKPNTIL